MVKLIETLRKKLPIITLEELFGYINEAEMGYIGIGYHPEDSNIVILNYTELTTFEKRWNKYTMSARGLILDLTDVLNNGKIYVLAKPFGKFPNLGEMPDYEEDIDLNDIDYVMEKMDGSLGISYFFKNEIRFATRGSFISEQAVKATEIWKKNHAEHEDLKAYVFAPATYLVEIIYPENRVVVDYGYDEKLVMLGVNYLFSDCDLNYVGLEWEASNLKMELAPKFHYTIEEMVEMKKTIPASEEGWVVIFRNGKRLKIKGDEYINVHRIMYGLSDKAKVRAWSEDDIDQYIMMLPEEFRPELESLFQELDKSLEIMKFVLDMLLRQAKESTKTRKEFALHVTSIISKELQGFMFRGYDKDDGVPVNMIKEYIYKNYKHYLEVITWRKQNQDS